MTRQFRVLLSAVTVAALHGPGAAWASTSDAGAGDVHPIAIVMFLSVIAVTLGITYWAAKRTRTAKDFYAAGNRITGFQNGLAISGDFLSAAALLGITGLTFGTGYDAVLYALSPLAGLAIIMFLMAERLRNLGKFTFADVASFRLDQGPVRTFAACGTLTVVTIYLIAQVVGAGSLIHLLFGLPYVYAVVLVGILMVLYVSLGGMLATTWVQIVKAVLLIFGITVLSIAALAQVGFDLGELYSRAAESHVRGQAIFNPGGLVSDPISVISVSLALVFGMAGLPHILMRFFTVPNAAEARRSVFIASGIIAYSLGLIFFVVGFGAIIMLSGNAQFADASGRLIGGNNMAAMHLARALGGEAFLGFMSGIAFATILAVVAGLTLAGASAVSHDLYANVWRRGKVSEGNEVKISRLATVCIGAVAILLGIVFEKQNIAYMAALAFAVAASANFPVLILSMYWRDLTTRGAVWGGYVGLIIAVVLVIFSPTVWVDALGNAAPIFPYKYPTVFSMPAAFVVIWLVSLTDKSARAARERAAFPAQYVRSETGVGAEKAAAE